MGGGNGWIQLQDRVHRDNKDNTDNKVADALSRVGEWLDDEAVKELLDQGAIKELFNHAVPYSVPRAEADDPWVLEEHKKAEGEIVIQARMLTETKKNYQNLADS